jgi:hypothetical protein
MASISAEFAMTIPLQDTRVVNFLVLKRLVRLASLYLMKMAAKRAGETFSWRSGVPNPTRSSPGPHHSITDLSVICLGQFLQNVRKSLREFMVPSRSHEMDDAALVNSGFEQVANRSLQVAWKVRISHG